MSRRFATLLSVCTLSGVALTPSLTAAQTRPSAVDVVGHQFVRVQGHRLFHRGNPFRVAGASNYYPMYASRER
jgi:hypothetical protein